MTQNESIQKQAALIATYLKTIQNRLDKISSMDAIETTWGDVADAGRLAADLRDIHCYLSGIDY